MNKENIFEVSDNENYDLTLVVPYYNPGPILKKYILELSSVLNATHSHYEIITVSDGSTDGSINGLDGLLPANKLRNIGLSKNHGKGQALRVGLAQGRGKYLGFIDADGDIPANQLFEFIEKTKESNIDIIIGSKRHPDSEVVYPPIRRIYSWLYQQIIKILFRLSVKDTQVGIKFIRMEVLEEVLPIMLEKRFAFDLELFVVCRKLGYKKIVELPVHIQKRFTSTISIKTAKDIVIDTLGIFYRLYISHYYDNAISNSKLKN